MAKKIKPLDEAGALAYLAYGEWYAGVHDGELVGECARRYHFYVQELAKVDPDVRALRDVYTEANRVTDQPATVAARKKAFAVLADYVGDVQRAYHK